MATHIGRAKFTYEDYLLFLEDGRRHELIDGDHFVTPAPATRHQRILQRLSLFIGQHVRATQAGELLFAPADVVLSDADVVQPDLLFVSAARAAIITEKNIQGPPDLVVEILSESTRKTDSVIKRKLYERHGVQEYWLVDPELEAVTVYRLSGGAYVRAAELSAEAKDSLDTGLLPGLKLPLGQIFG